MAFVFKPVVTRTKNGRKVRRRTRFWWIGFNLDVDGKDGREALRLPDGQKVTDRETAEAELRRRGTLRQRLTAGLTNRYVEAAPMSARKLLADYARHLRRKLVRGRPVSRGHIRFTVHVVKWFLGFAKVTRVGELTEERFTAALDWLQSSGAKSNRTLNAYRARLSAWCAYGVKPAHVLEHNPAASTMTYVDKAVRTRRALTPDEASRLLDKAGPRRLWYEVALYTGLRVSELAALRWSDLVIDDTFTPCIRLRPEATKNGKGGRLPLRRSLADGLKAARPTFARGEDRVFPTTPTRKTFLADCQRAGVDHKDAGGRTVDRHALRTTFSAWLRAAGTDIYKFKKLIRHGDIRTTMKHYGDESQLDDVSAVESLPDLDNLPRPDTEAQEARATGTDNAKADTLRPVVPGVVLGVVLKGGEGHCTPMAGQSGSAGETGVTYDVDKTKQRNSLSYKLEPKGLEPSTSCMPCKRPASENAVGDIENADSGGHDTSCCTGGCTGNRKAVTADADPDLMAVVAAWPTLPDAIKAGIVAMVKAAAGSKA